MVKRRGLVLGSILMSGLSGCGYRLADFETTCKDTFEIRNKTDNQISVDFKIESEGEPDINRSITIDSGSNKGYCDLIQGGDPVKVTIDTNAHSETTRVYDDYQHGYVILVKIFKDTIEFEHMLV